MTVNCESLGLMICFGAYFFFLGAEYAVILPTLNDYLRSMDADNTFLGVVLASFSFAGLITAPIYGYITDKMGTAKASIIVGNILEVVGNFMYFVGRNKYFVLGGRIIAGLGSGAMSSIMGTLSRATSEKQRTSSFAILLMLRQFGLIIAPGFNAFLYKLNFKLGPFDVNAESSPGLFMVLLWTINTLMFLFLYSDRHTRGEENDVATPNNDSQTDISQVEMNISRSRWRAFLREEVVLLLAVAFFSSFVQTGVEAALTPLTLMYFDWHGLLNSYLLLGAGFVVLLAFGCVTILSKRFDDRALLLSGCVALALGYGSFMALELELSYTWDELVTPSWLLPVLAIIMFIWIVGICFVVIPNISLFSKLTKRETQAFNQGVRIGMTRMGMILGPLWATPLVSKRGLPILAAVNFTFSLILVLMVIGSFKYLLPPPNVEDDASTTDEPTESSRLLA